LAARQAGLASTTAKRTSMYYNKPQRNMDEADMLRGVDQERANEKNPFFKLFDKYADLYYDFIYKRRPNSAYPKIFEANKFCRMIAVDGIPGSGFEQVGHDLAAHQNLNVRERSSLYYFWERYGRADTPLRKELTESFKNGGPGNYWEEQYRMDWSNVYAKPGDWRELCKTLSWQMRGMRLQESDTLVEHLLQMKGTVNIQNYFSYRAEIHACGETGRIPADMHQSFIDQWNHMEGFVFPYPVMVYIDCDPEIAYANIQNSDKYSEAEKAFYSLDYLRAYKEGYEEFVLPKMSELETLIFKFEPGQVKTAEDLCDIMITQEPDMVHYANQWHMRNSFMQTAQYSTKYMILLATHMDMGHNQTMTTPYCGSASESFIWPTFMSRDMENEKARCIIEWKYPREGIDGFGWGWDNMHSNSRVNKENLIKTKDLELLQTMGDGFHAGQNDRDVQKNGLPLWLNTMFNSTHRQMLGGVGLFPGDQRSNKTFWKQSI